MQIKGVSAGIVEDSRGKKTISVSVRTNSGVFEASSPQGKSTGVYEARPYKISLQKDIKELKKIFKGFVEIEILGFSDLAVIEDIVKRRIGANTLFALESAILKALAFAKRKKVWQIINPKADKIIPVFVGNCIGGGMHTKGRKKPDFQEFLIISRNIKNIREVYEELYSRLKKKDNSFNGQKNDENAWVTGLGNEDILQILFDLKQNINFDIGIDAASSTFYSYKRYKYKNPGISRTLEEQLFYMKSLANSFQIYYLEDPFEENDFFSFARLKKMLSDTLIVGDDLTATNPQRLKAAIEQKSINAIIVKPNQIGSLLKVKEVCGLAKDNNIKIIFSHRSGETPENILADLAVGFGADFIKCGVIGKGRDEKIKRILEIKEEMGKK
jgi:enolase